MRHLPHARRTLRALRRKQLHFERLEQRRLLASIRVSPIADNTLFESSGGSLSNGAGSYFFVGRTDQAANSLRRGLLKFDLASIPSGATIDHVELTLNMSRTISGAHDIELRRVLQDWGEGDSNAPGQEGAGAQAQAGDATWRHTLFSDAMWDTPGGDFVDAASASTSVSNVGNYSWTGSQMIADVQQWLDHPESSFGWLLLGDESTARSAKRFDTREHDNEQSRPSLLIEYSEPARVEVVIQAGSIAENAGERATVATIARVNSDLSTALEVSLETSDTSELSVPPTVTIPANEASVTISLDAVDDALLDGNQTVVLTATAANHNSGSDTIQVTDHETLTLLLDRNSVREDAGSGAALGTLRVSNTDRDAPLTLQLTSSDSSELSVPESVTIPAGTDTATFFVAARDDQLLDGTQQVTVSASGTGYVSGDAFMAVMDYETVTIVVDEQAISEAAGTSATMATVSRSNLDNSQPLSVLLSNSDLSEVSIADSIVIPAEQASVRVPLDAVDDQLLDGDQVVLLTPTALGYASVATELTVTDFESLSLIIDADSIPEDSGPAAVKAQVSRANVDLDSPLQVHLHSDDQSEAMLPPTVTIPANQSSVAFEIDIVDDRLLDGTQRVEFVASAPGYVNGLQNLSVLDAEQLQLEIAAAAIDEDAGMNATVATVTRSNSDTELALDVQLSNSDLSEVMVPDSVTIPAGASSVQFSLDAVDDTLLDGAVTVTLSASAEGYDSLADILVVEDVELLSVSIPTSNISESTSQPIEATVRRQNTDIGQPITVRLSSSDPSEATVPSEVTLPANVAAITFEIVIVDDQLDDDTQQVEVFAEHAAYVAQADTLDVLDNEYTAVLTASRDNTLYEEDQGQLSNGVGDYLFVGVNSQGAERRALLGFDLSNLSTAAEVLEAHLELQMNRTNSGPLEIQLHEVLAAWGEGASNAEGSEGQGAPSTEGDATWIHRQFSDVLWDLPGGDWNPEALAKALVEEEGTYQWQGVFVTAAVQKWIQSPELNHGWILVSPEATSGNTKRFTSRDHTATEMDKPQLNLLYSLDNQPPQVVNPPQDQATFEYVPIAYQLPENIFRDPDGDDLEITLTQADGSELLDWLSYDPVTRVLSGKPQRADVGTMTLRVTATDTGTPPANESVTFMIDVVANPHPWKNPLDALDVNLDKIVTPLDVLLMVNHINANGAGELPIPPESPFTPAPFLDISGDDLITAFDVLLAVNFLNSQGGREGESSQQRSAPDLVAAQLVPWVAREPSTIAPPTSLPISMSFDKRSSLASPTANSRSVLRRLVEQRSFTELRIGLGAVSDQTPPSAAILDWDALASEDLDDLLTGVDLDEPF